MKEETKKNIESNVQYRFWMFWFITAMLFTLSLAINNQFFGIDADYFEYMFVSPFSSSKTSVKYFQDFYIYAIFMFTIAIFVRLFFFANPNRKYVSKLENAKRVILNLLPFFYFDGKNARNNYIRFGFEDSFRNGFYERKISQGEYLKKVSHLKIFTGDYSPEHILNLKSDFIGDSFHSKDGFYEIFRIIEHYIQNNIDVIQDIPLSKYLAIGSDETFYTNDSVFAFIKIIVPQNNSNFYAFSKKEAENKFKSILEQNKDKKNDKKKLNKAFIGILTKNNFELYTNFAFKTVVFSPLALKEFIVLIENEGKRFIKKQHQLRTATVRNIEEYGIPLTEDFLEILKFLTFYKIISFFVGLPSGIITARIKHYGLARIVDDIEMFEKNLGIRQIKYLINDTKGKYNDTFARAYMIFHHELSFSQNSIDIEKFFEKFDALRIMSINDTNSNELISKLQNKLQKV